MRLAPLRLCIFALALTGCGGKESGDSGGRHDVDLGDARIDGEACPSPCVDAAPYDVGRVPDALPPVEVGPVEVGPVPDSGRTCPPYQPSEGMGCDGGPAVCTYPDEFCATTATVRCLGGTWHTDPSSCPSARCPYPPPSAGAGCPVNTEVCTYWKGVARDCMATTCTGGTWTALAACTMPEAECSSGVSCASPSGCAVDKCSNQCICGADGVRHCTAAPC